MTTGIDARTCKIIAIDKIIKSMTEFKQIIGRGSRLSPIYNKYWFTIIDYRGATALFDDPAWDGDPIPQKPKPTLKGKRPKGIKVEHPRITGQEVFIEHRIVRVIDNSTGELKIVTFEDYAGRNVRLIAGDLPKDLQNIWVDLEKRRHFESELERAGITMNHVRQILENYDKDIFDLLSHIAYDKGMVTRRQRADNAKKKQFYLEKQQIAQKVIDVILDHYSEKGYKELELDKSRELLELSIFDEFGNLEGILQEIFENPEKFDKAITDMTGAIYEDQA